MADPRNDMLLGRTLGDVVITGRLGQGAMCLVYKGRHQRFDIDVAVKVMLPRHDAKGATYRKRFLREGRAAAKVSHPNVVQVMAGGEADEGIAYLVMEYVDGPALGTVVDNEGAQAIDDVREWTLQMLEGIAAIHNQGIVHRDIKPDNILISSKQVVKITDLGLARIVDDETAMRLTATGVVVGTPLYVAPEAIRRSTEASPAADMYSFGASLYHILTGKPPYDGRTPFEVMRAHLEDPVPRVEAVRPEVSRELAEVIAKCMAKNPADRPAAADLLRQMTFGTLGQNPVAAVAAKERSGNAGLILVVVALVLLVVILSLILVLFLID